MVVYKALLKTIKGKMTSLIIYFVVFAVFGSIVAKQNSKSMDSMFEAHQVVIALVDQDDSELSRGIAEAFSQTDKIEKVKASTEDDLKKLNDNVRFDIYDDAILIPSGFEANVLAGHESGAEFLSKGQSASSTLMYTKFNTFVKNVTIYMNAGFSETEAIANATDDMEKAEPEIEMVKANDKTGHSLMAVMYAFMAYSMMMILSIGIATIISSIKKKDLMARITVSPMSSFRQNLEQVLAITTFGLVVLLAMILVVCIFLGNEADYSKIWYYSINSAALMVVGISFAFFLGTISQDEGVIELVSNMVFLGMSFISGVFVTRDFMSESVLKVAHFLPVYWYVSGTEQIDTAKVSEIWGSGLVGSLAMQLLFALLFMGAGFVVARKKERYVL